MEIPERKVTALIGLRLWKSTFLRSINRMNDLIDIARVEGDLRFHGKNVYDEDVDPVALRRKIGMVFQKPNPFPKSIYDNVAYGLRVQGKDDDVDEQVHTALERAALQTRSRTNSTPPGSICRADNNSDCVSLERSPRSGGHSDGRTCIRAGPGRHLENRGFGRGVSRRVHGRDRHPQHATGGAYLR